MGPWEDRHYPSERVASAFWPCWVVEMRGSVDREEDGSLNGERTSKVGEVR